MCHRMARVAVYACNQSKPKPIFGSHLFGVFISMKEESLPANVQQLIDSSGNSFHARVARWFKENGWHVRVSPYYLDRGLDKAREIDLVVEKPVEIRDFAGRFEGNVVIRLFVECKYVNSSTVFWFADRDGAAAENLVTTGSPFRSDNMYTRKHHYLAEVQVAKVFASDSSRGSELEWMYKALNQVLNATTSMAEQNISSPQLQNYKARRVILDFPVIVCSSFENSYRTDFFEKTRAEKISGNFQIEVQYAYHNAKGEPRDGYFLVDVVEFSRLSELDSAVAEDASVAAYMASTR